MVNLSLVALTLTGASLVAAHSGVKADGGPAHLKMISKVNKRSSSSKCSGSTRARKSYKNRHASSPSSSSSAQDAGTSAKAPQVKAVKNEQQSTTASKVFSTKAPKSNPTTTSAKAAETTYSTGTSAGDSTGKGMFGVSGPCGDSGAVNTPTNDNGPNGSEDWLNCGISAGGWNPPSYVGRSSTSTSSTVC